MSPAPHRPPERALDPVHDRSPEVAPLGASASAAAAVATRYAKRGPGANERHSILRPEVWNTLHERQRETLMWLQAKVRAGCLPPLDTLTALELGCGAGGNLLDLLRWGCMPEHVCGIELLPERYAHACRVLPANIALLLGDATELEPAGAPFDLCLAFTVFSSILEDDAQRRLATRLWQWVRPGGAVLWYDLAVNNPANADVRGVPVRRVRELFPHAQLEVKWVTLAPPLARWACRLGPSLYDALNWFAVLRTHRLIWLTKPQ